MSRNAYEYRSAMNGYFDMMLQCGCLVLVQLPKRRYSCVESQESVSCIPHHISLIEWLHLGIVSKLSFIVVCICNVCCVFSVPNVPPCESSPCQNGGTCVTHDKSYTCDCLPGWSGTNCVTREWMFGLCICLGKDGADCIGVEASQAFSLFVMLSFAVCLGKEAVQ